MDLIKEKILSVFKVNEEWNDDYQNYIIHADSFNRISEEIAKKVSDRERSLVKKNTKKGNVIQKLNLIIKELKQTQ